jgi:uncharacterized membrane protein YfcA
VRLAFESSAPHLPLADRQLLDFSPSTIALVVAIFLFAGTVKGLIGVGLPTIAVALLIHVMPLPEAMPLVVIPAIITNLWQAVIGGQGREALRRFWLLYVLLAIGTWVGVGILTIGNPRLIGAVFGAILTTYALMGLARPAPLPVGIAERWLTPVIGSINGLLNGMTGSYILPGTLYLQSLGLGRDALIQSMGILYLVASTSLGVALTGHSIMGWHEALLSTAVLLPALAGYATGQHFRRQLPDEHFRRVFFIGLILLGIYTLGSSL